MKIKIFNYTINITKNRSKYKNWKRRIFRSPQDFDAPNAPKGYRHRWIRIESLEDTIPERSKSAISIVKPKKGEKNKYPIIDEGVFKGYIGIGGLILARIPERIFKMRDNYMKGRA
tara:strand:+ start:341 stop:688 length:348 start_codon:yes stop_codon:yes gene_type:complete